MIGPSVPNLTALSTEEFQLIRDLKSIEHENFLVYQEAHRYGSSDAFLISIDFHDDGSVYALKLETIKGEESAASLRLVKRYFNLVERATSLIEIFNRSRRRKIVNSSRRYGTRALLHNYHFLDGEGNVI